MALHKRIGRVFLENKAQYLGSMVLIMFSTFMFTLMSHFAMNFERLAIDFQNRHVQEDATFTPAERLSNLQEIEAATKAEIEEGTTFDYTLADGRKVRLFSWNDRINLPAIIEGAELSDSGTILIDPTFAAANDYKIGDEMEILGKSFTIVGFMALPNYIYPLRSETDMMPLPNFGIAVIGKEDFAALGQGTHFYAVKFNQADQNPRDLAAQFRARLTSEGVRIVKWTDIEDNKRVNIVTAEIDILNVVSRMVPTAILVLAIIMISNLIGRMIDRESAIIGSLYALGYKKNEIYRHYLLFPLLIASVGSIIGTILGTFPVRAAVSFFTTVFSMPLTGIEFSPIRMILSLLLPILFLGVSSYLVIRKELQHSPVELMRGKEEKNRVNFLERMLDLERFNFATKFRIREQLRSLSRLAFLLSGIVVATILLLWGFSLYGSFDYLTSGLTDVYHFTYEYQFNELRYEPLPAGAEPGAAALFLPEGEEDARKDFHVTGILPDSAMLTLVDESGARLSTNQVIITKPLAEQLQVKAGERVTVVRKEDGRPFSLTIDCVADSYAGKFIFMPLAEYNERFGMPEGSYTGVFSNVLLDIPETQSYSVVSLEEKIAGVQEVIAPTLAMLGFLATIAFIIGMIVIYVVTLMIVEENRNTISLMKIFGYRKQEINALILNSSTVVVAISYLLGIPLMLAALGALIQSMEETVGLSLPPASISLPYLLLGFLVVMLAYEISKRLCRKKVYAVSMSEALKAGTE